MGDMNALRVTVQSFQRNNNNNAADRHTCTYVGCTVSELHKTKLQPTNAAKKRALRLN